MLDEKQLHSFVERGRRAQEEADEILSAFAAGPNVDDPVCVSCGCWELDACSPPCSWQPTEVPLCSGCGPPLVLALDPAGDLLDVDDVILEIVLNNGDAGICPADVPYIAPQYGVHADDVHDALERLLDEGSIEYVAERMDGALHAARWPGTVGE